MTDRNYLDCKDDYLSCGDDYLSCKDDDYLNCVIEPTPPLEPPVLPPYKPRKDDDFVYEIFFKAFVFVHFFVEKLKKLFKGR